MYRYINYFHETDSDYQFWTLTPPAIHTYDTLTKFITLEKGRVFYVFDIGSLSIGDIVEVDCEIENISGDKFRFALNNSTTSINEYIVDTQHEGYKKVKLKFVIQSNSPYKLNCGFFSNNNGISKMRNLKIRVKTQKSTFSEELLNKKSLSAAFEIKNGEVLIRNGYGEDKCTFTTDVYQILVTFDKSLKFNALAFCNKEYAGNSYNYDVRISYASKNYCALKIFNAGTKTAVPLADIVGSLYVSVLLMN